MKNLKSNFILKLTAIILVCVSVTVFAYSAVCIAYGLSSGAFEEDKARREEAYREQKDSLLHAVTNNLTGRINLQEKGNYETADFPYIFDENIMYDIKNEEGEIVHSTVDGSKYQMTHEQIHRAYWPAVYEEPEPETETTSVPYDEYETDAYGGFSEEESTTEAVMIKPEERENLYVTVYLKEDITEKDGFYTLERFFNYTAENKTNFYTAAAVSLIVSIFAFIFLMCASGHKSGEEDLHISRFDKFPVDILTVLFGAGIFGAGCIPVFLIEDTVWQAESLMWHYSFDVEEMFKISVVFALICAPICVFFLTVLCMTVAVRLKTKTLIDTSVIGRLLKLIFKWTVSALKHIFKWIKNMFAFFYRTAKKIPLVWKTVLITAVIAIVLFVCLVGAWSSEAFIVFGILFTIACCALLILVSIMLRTIKNGTEEIVNGNTGKKIDTKYMIGDVKRHAENINSINDGIAKAVEQRMKSERFKTELITNVSHDIKTPLTSIINYVDLLEKEDIDNEKAQEYIEVLSRQSTRLKKLIEDLIEASKASTGNLQVNMSKFEIGILLTQALGEYEEKFKKADLEVVLNKPEDMLFVMADSRHMWRIFDNVLNNITKYAMPHTRVYIDVKRFGRNVEVLFKNISREQLNISGEELMERFVRGDSSRNTEGSGLGLSIAKNLAQLQNGSFNIQIDGDLFKITLALPLSE